MTCAVLEPVSSVASHNPKEADMQSCICSGTHRGYSYSNHKILCTLQGTPSRARTGSTPSCWPKYNRYDDAVPFTYDDVVAQPD